MEEDQLGDHSILLGFVGDLLAPSDDVVYQILMNVIVAVRSGANFPESHSFVFGSIHPDLKLLG